ncbi:restriction endonuclease [Nonomuraea wenchangensis]
MPARSNDFQAVVYFVKAHLDPNVTVTESASLPDRTSGKMREVDVLLTAHVAGHRVQIGVECRDRGRKADVPWVEEMRAKHADLPTDRLVLVSASGFTRTALIKAQHYNIETVTPERPIAQDGPLALARLKHPLADLHNIVRRDLVAIHGQVEFDDGQLHESEPTLDHVLFTADGTEIGHIADLIVSTRDRLDPRAAIAAMYEQVRTEQQVVWSSPADVFLRLRLRTGGREPGPADLHRGRRRRPFDRPPHRRLRHGHRSGSRSGRTGAATAPSIVKTSSRTRLRSGGAVAAAARGADFGVGDLVVEQRVQLRRFG